MKALSPLPARKSIDNKGRLVLSRKCRITSQLISLTIELADYHRWQGGELAQKIWPELARINRELLETGYTAAEWEALFIGSINKNG